MPVRRLAPLLRLGGVATLAALASTAGLGDGAQGRPLRDAAVKPAPAASHAAAVALPLATRGADIVDARGHRVVLQGVNWFGFETSNHVAHGLWSRDYRDMLQQIRSLGFNTIRIPFSLQALDSTTLSGVDFAGGRNAALQGKTPQEALDVIVSEAGRQGLMVILDCHSLADDGYQHGLWYGQGGYSEDDWVRAWQRLARRYSDVPNVIGADLKNEPHGEATWGTGGPTDFRRAAERAGNAVLAANPRLLVLVEGIEGSVAGQRLDTHWWGGNLEGVRRAPVRLSHPHRLVYSPHEYGPGVFPQPWFAGSEAQVARTLRARWDAGFGYLTGQGIAPVLVGEFGGRDVGTGTVEGRWQRQFLDYIARQGLSWTYWSWNPDSGDTGGVLQDDWKTPVRAKAHLLRDVIRRQGARRPERSAGRVAPALTTPKPGPPAGSTSLAATIAVEQRWESGWCGHIALTGPAGTALGGRHVAFDLAAGSRLQSSWNGAFALSGRRVMVTLPDWAQLGGDGTYTGSGLCVAGSGTPSHVTVP